MTHRVAIVGAGLAGLACAERLHARGFHTRVFEGADAVGGRVRTDRVTTPEGEYQLDRGFQVYLTAYPAASGVFDHEALKLRRFYPGAVVHHDKGSDRVADPYRLPLDAAGAAFGSVAKTSDLVAMGVLDRRLRAGAPDDLWDRPDIATIDMLREAGVSDRLVRRFLRPFFGGVFFDPDLRTSARMFRFTYRMFATGDTAVPDAGMGELPRQIAARLPEGTVACNAPVARCDARSVTLGSGETYDADAVVIATDADSARTLAPGSGADHEPIEWCPTATLWYATEHAPDTRPILHLDGTGHGPVNHLAVMSAAAPGYAPAGWSLVCANLVGDWARRVIHADADTVASDIDPHVRTQLGAWFGNHARGWRLIGVHRIPKALPAQPVGHLDPPSRTVPSDSAVDRDPDTPYLCGDWLESASIEGAVRSGMLIADRVADDLAPATPSGSAAAPAPSAPGSTQSPSGSAPA